jgi:hypothetical protein
MSSQYRISNFYRRFRLTDRIFLEGSPVIRFCSFYVFKDIFYVTLEFSEYCTECIRTYRQYELASSYTEINRLNRLKEKLISEIFAVYRAALKVNAKLLRFR